MVQRSSVACFLLFGFALGCSGSPSSSGDDVDDVETSVPSEETPDDDPSDTEADTSASDDEPAASNDAPANQEATDSGDDVPPNPTGPDEPVASESNESNESNEELTKPTPDDSKPPVDDADPRTPSEPSDVPSDDIVHPDAPLCPGHEPNAATSCVDDAECPEGMQCLFENAPPSCNLGCAGPMDQCGDDMPCPDGMLCTGTPAAEIHSSCACGGGTYCVAPCMTDEDCSAGNQCQPDGLCQAISCDDGFACAASLVCDSSAPEADAHGCRLRHCSDAEHPGCSVNWVCDPEAPGNGCVRQSCSVGADCECGACSPHGSECVARPGVCAQLSATAG